MRRGKKHHVLSGETSVQKVECKNGQVISFNAFVNMVNPNCFRQPKDRNEKATTMVNPIISDCRG